MFNILFVCTGNTCRSVMAEYIFNDLNLNNNLSGSSAGISVIPDSSVTTNTIDILEKFLDIKINGRKAVQINKDLIEQNQLVLCMTDYIKEILVYNFPNNKDKIHNIHQYVGKQGDVIDPFGGDIEIYKETYRFLRKDIELLINKIQI
ncbi:low molecular weight protein arginine phosphatase [Clostridium sp. DL1XJH146]